MNKIGQCKKKYTVASKESRYLAGSKYKTQVEFREINYTCELQLEDSSRVN